MKSLLVVVALLALSDALSPPNIADTFIATGEVEIHTAEGTNIGGKFTIARDQKNNMGLEEVEYGGTNQIAKMIQRYDLDKKKTYYVRGNVGQEHCIEEESMGQLSPFFDWVPLATYEGKKTYHELLYDTWGYTLADIRFEVSVNGSIPELFNRYTAEYFVQFSVGIDGFNATTPPASMFDPPKECSRGTRPLKFFKPQL